MKFTKVYNVMYCKMCKKNTLHYFVSKYRMCFKNPGWYCNECNQRNND
jgi:hypothetical protein